MENLPIPATAYTSLYQTTERNGASLLQRDRSGYPPF